MRTILNTINEAQDPIVDKKVYQVTAYLKRYRIAKLERMGQTNSSLVTDFLYSKMREGGYEYIHEF